ncbi:MAG TPA: cell envelope integrity protein TolA [Steroidobacteraceae bacterium]|jgi:colicin import membrane protein|nr:cell envelope integrity protein TolA [Steroidobacteraceae bacterium]
MPPRERSPNKGGWRAVALSVLLHAGIVAAAVYGWFSWKHRPPPPTTLAIAATVVDERALKNLPAAPAPAPEPKPVEPAPEPEPEPEEQGPPKPDPAEIERKKEEERLKQEKLEQEKQEAEKQEQERLENEKKEVEKQAAAKAAAEKAAAEKAAAEKKAAEKKKAEEAAAAKKAAEEKARQATEAELRRKLEAEERGNALRNSDQANRWYAMIVAKIERAWIKPGSARPGVTCIVSVSQVPGGEVTAVRVNSCSIEDAALRQSVENAVYSASPLPPPPDPALFERNLELTFAPQ